LLEWFISLQLKICAVGSNVVMVLIVFSLQGGSFDQKNQLLPLRVPGFICLIDPAN